MSGFTAGCSFCMMAFICVFCSSVRFSCLAKNPIIGPGPPIPNSWPCPGGGGGVSAVVCDLAIALPSKMAKTAIDKRKRNDFMCDSSCTTLEVLREVPGTVRTEIETRFRKKGGKESVNQSKVLSMD